MTLRFRQTRDIGLDGRDRARLDAYRDTEADDGDVRAVAFAAMGRPAPTVEPPPTRSRKGRRS